MVVLFQQHVFVLILNRGVCSGDYIFLTTSVTSFCRLFSKAGQLFVGFGLFVKIC